MANIMISKNEWRKYLIIPSNCYFDIFAYADRVEYSLKVEGFVTDTGYLLFNEYIKVSDFLLAYKNFFTEDFIDVIIKKAVNNNNNYSNTINFGTAEFDLDILSKILGEN